MNCEGLVHIFEKIFLPLDAESLVNCSTVSRSLAAKLKNPRFWFKVCKQRNLINRCFKEWNKLLEITEESVPRKEDISRTLKIFCINKKDCLKKVSEIYGHGCHPLPLAIFCQELKLADLILQFSRDSETFSSESETDRLLVILKHLQMSGIFKWQVLACRIESIGQCFLMRKELAFMLNYNREINVFKECLENPKDLIKPWTWRKNGDNLIHLAAKFGYINVLKDFVSVAKNLNVQNKEKLTPLALAVKHGNIEIVKLLISKNVNLNIPDKHGETPFDYAVKNGFDEIIKILLSHSVSSPLKSIRVLLFSAKMKYSRNYIKAYIRKHEKEMMFRYEKDIKLFKTHLAVFNDLLQGDENGDTWLHLAAKYGCFNIMKVLTNLTDDLNVQNKNLLTPLALAVKNRKIDVVRFLISTNVDLGVPVIDGMTAFDYAVRNEFDDIIDLLESYTIK